MNSRTHSRILKSGVAILLVTFMALPPAYAADTFSVKHPRIYKGWRKTRKVCTVSLPVVQWLGAAAQIVSIWM